jgi:hypothetical protein
MSQEEQKKYLKIASVVDQFLIDNDLTEHYFQKALSWALWGLRELHMDTWNDVKTILLTITDRKTVVLPVDFVDWVKVAVKRGQYAITLGVNSELTELPREANSNDVVAGLLSQHLPNGLDFNAYGGYYFYNYNGSSFASYGYGLPSKGAFKLTNNGNCQELLLDYDIRATQIYLEYITTGFDPCQETVIHPYIADYILKYIEYKYEDKSNPNRTESSIYRRSEDLFFAEKKVRGRSNDLDPKTLLNITRANTRLTPKM